LKLGEDEVKPEGAAGRCRTRQRAGLQRAQQIQKRIAVPKLNETPVRASSRSRKACTACDKRDTCVLRMPPAKARGLAR